MTVHPPASPTHDLIIIGSGSGNSVITSPMRDWRIAMVEEWTMGGTCLNRGCIPSKMFVLAAERALHAADSSRFGLDTSFIGADWPAIRDRVFGRIDPIAASGRDYRAGQDNVDLYEAHGRFVGPHTLQVGDEQISAPNIVLAAGARAVVPHIDGLDTVDWHTSDSIMRLDELPASMVIIGGGFVAVEMAHVFAGLGTDVTMVVRGDQLLRHEDTDVARVVTRAYARRVDLHLSTVPTAVKDRDGSVAVTLPDGREVVADALLLATGRVPNSDTLGVAETGVEVDDNGYVVVDEHQRTTVDGIWALGDISDPVQLKHKANEDARIVAHNLTHPDDLRAQRMGPVPHAVFGSPQVASVGLTEARAIDAGADHLAITHEYASTAYGWALEDTSSLVKLVVDRGDHSLLGAHLVGPQASTLIQPLLQAMAFDQPIDDLARRQWWIHPSLPEVVEQALLKAEEELA